MTEVSAVINLLRLRLQAANAIFSSEGTHDVLRQSLGGIWDDAINYHEGNKTEAAKFLLQPSGYFKGKSAFDTILEGDDGINKYNLFLETLHLSHQ